MHILCGAAVIGITNLQCMGGWDRTQKPPVLAAVSLVGR